MYEHLARMFLGLRKLTENFAGDAITFSARQIFADTDIWLLSNFESILLIMNARSFSDLVLFEMSKQ